MTPEATAIQTLFFILNKEGRKVPFRLNKAQLFLDSSESKRILIAKARQKGFSAYILGKTSIRCLGREGRRAVVMSHEAGATQRLLDRVQYYLKHMNGPKPVFGRHSRNELYFEKSESTFYIGTAGAKAFGRGDTITDLHCSEYAWWEETAKHHGGLFQAVPMTGDIVIESTGNGRNNDFYLMWQKADEMNYERMFYPWFADEEYVIQNDWKKWTPDIPSLNGYLLDLKDRLKLPDEKMNWYCWKLKELRENLKLMQQEYPSDPEDCFQASGGSLFPLIEIQKSESWAIEKFEGYYCNRLKGHPKEGFSYIIGADPSGGTGNDDAAVDIICAQTGEQVFELNNNTISPPKFAELLVEIGFHFNTSYIVPEANNHGITVVEMLKDKYPREMIYKRKLGTSSTPPQYGWMNTNHTKHALVGMMQEDLADVIIYGAGTQAELASFEEDDKGKMGSRSDNLVIAFGLAMLGYKKFYHLRGEHLKPPPPPKLKVNYMTYTLDEALDNIRGRSNGGFFHRVGRGE